MQNKSFYIFYIGLQLSSRHPSHSVLLNTIPWSAAWSIKSVGKCALFLFLHIYSLVPIICLVVLLCQNISFGGYERWERKVEFMGINLNRSLWNCVYEYIIVWCWAPFLLGVVLLYYTQYIGTTCRRSKFHSNNSKKLTNIISILFLSTYCFFFRSLGLQGLLFSKQIMSYSMDRVTRNHPPVSSTTITIDFWNKTIHKYSYNTV